MAKGFKHGAGGGGGGLNFKVVGGTTEPTNPKENMIWVNTDQKITGWVFSATEPKAPIEGMVWIDTGTSSTGAFNALKKNGIQVYPISATQYISGAWVDKTATSYQGGEWVDWLVYLYKDGDQCEPITGGWEKSGLIWVDGFSNGGTIAYNEYLTVSTSAGKQYDATTKNKIDLTNYSELRFEMGEGTTKSDQVVVIHDLTSGELYGRYIAAAGSDANFLSLEGISGSHYISIVAPNGRTAEVGNIRLVR